MKGLKKFKDDNHASNFVMARLLGVSEEYYLKLEGLLEEKMPPRIKQGVENLMSNPDLIKDYYDRQSEYLNKHTKDDILDRYNVTPTDISNTTLININEVEDFINKGIDFERKSTFDKFFDYMMYLEQVKVVKENQMNKDIVPKDVEPEPNEDMSDVSKQFPEIPKEEPSPVENVPMTDKDVEIAGLNRQIEWYEELLTCFTHLANLATRENK